MELEPRDAMRLCADAHRRLFAALDHVDDATAARPSRLPGWTVGHVITHLARNADSHARRLEGALRGEEVRRYPGGHEERDRSIDAGATRSATELRDDARTTSLHLEEVWERSAAAGWPGADLMAGDDFPTSGSPLFRLLEVEVHHVDLGLGYEPERWPPEFVDAELPRTLRRLPGRVASAGDRARLLAWLSGRAPEPGDIELAPWM